MDVAFTVINESDCGHDIELVVFQKNAARDADELLVAWKVIHGLGRGERHPFTFHAGTAVAVGDPWGNDAPQFSAAGGEVDGMSCTPSGHELSWDGPGASPHEILCRNDQKETVSVGLYRSGRLLMQRPGVAPGATASFVIEPTLFLTVCSGLAVGELLPSHVFSPDAFAISLRGLRSATIVVSGAGPGRQALPFIYQLAEVEPIEPPAPRARDNRGPGRDA